MNQYMLCCKTTNTAALIDCGDDNIERWLDAAEEEGMTITKILQTHGHVDHVSGLKDTKDALDVPIHACPDDWVVFKSAPMQSMAFGMSCPPPPSIDVSIHEGDIIEVGDLRVKVYHTPGHSPGHVCFEVVGSGSLISGDLIFEGSIGRTDFPGCNQEDMKRSLNRIKTEFSRDVKLFPGHMGVTTVGREIDTNPFLQELDNNPSTANPCNYQAIECSPTGHVTSIDMNGFKLTKSDTGTSGSSTISIFCTFPHLEVLRLSDNLLPGRLPPCLSSMSNLTTLDLSWNRFESTISRDFFSLMPELTSLNLGSNMFVGPVPDFSPNTKLVSLDLSINAHSDHSLRLGFNSFLTSSQFPLSLLNVDFSKNSIEGPVPARLCDTEIRRVDLSDNILEGSVVHCFQGDVSKVEYLDFGGNYLNGTLPSTWSMFHLETLSISDNYFTGPFPTFITSAPSLAYVNVGSNGFAGPLPSYMVSTTISSFSAYDNFFTGPIPDEYLEWPVEDIDISYNHIEGLLNWDWMEVDTLKSFKVGNNYLEGGIPWSYSDGLQVVDLSWNWFEGPIPTNITGRFTSFEFENNFLTGLVPQSLWAQPLLMYTNKWISADSAACPVGTSGDIDGAPFPDGSCVLCHNTTCAPYLAQSYCPVGCGYVGSQEGHDNGGSGVDNGSVETDESTGGAVGVIIGAAAGGVVAVGAAFGVFYYVKKRGVYSSPLVESGVAIGSYPMDLNMARQVPEDDLMLRTSSSGDWRRMGDGEQEPEHEIMQSLSGGGGGSWDVEGMQ